MVNKTLTILTLLLIFLLDLTGQQIVPCLFDIGLHNHEISNPGHTQKLFKRIEKYREENANRSLGILKVKVVFHVVYKDDAENVSDALINEQVDILNRHFRRQNEDTINMRPIFADVAGDSGIEFVLDEIRRVKTTATFTPTFSKLPDEVKGSTTGGSDAKDPDKYLNIWICELQPLDLFGSKSPILGYAYPPDSLDHWPANSSAPNVNLDGVVLDFRTFTEEFYEIEMLGSIPMKGKTCVHEVGHYLGLRHISGDGGLFGPSCGASDGVEDTPEQGMQSQFDCNTEQNTCGIGDTGDQPDMIENYMDYSNEDCQNTFTKGQIEIMRGVLTNIRKGLLTISSTDNNVLATNKYIISPNPANQFIHVNALGGASPITDLSIYDNFGKLMIQNPPIDQNKIDVSFLPSGLYFVKVNDHPLQKVMITAH
ncbi:MAG: zinc-dependent metalloprotease [Saprospiraceae bacterium]|nr:zinc-dependent metalloprotease [Saprospiraceae bacterium]MBP7305624.1 zinc-dependent metalloprotease [Saprospiraceae bacterium]